MEEKFYQIALGTLPHVGNKSSKNLLAYCGSAKKVFHTPKQTLLKIPGIGTAITNAIHNKSSLINAEVALEKAQKEGVKILFFSDEDYPNRLKQIPDAPPLIYYKGTANLDTAKILAVVGTRNVTPYGLEMTDQLIKGLQGMDLIIVSGLAYGVDIAAHKASLKYGLPTVGVMANGIDQIYPWRHRKTSLEMIEYGGGLLTEEAFGTSPTAQRFPARNRIVAGMSDAILVVESAQKGGSLITANMGFDYDKEILAVPGNHNQKYSEGCNNLIKEQKAHLVTDTIDILKIMNWDADSDQQTSSKNVRFLLKPENYSAEQYNLLKFLHSREICDKDELGIELNMDNITLSSTLLSLELEDLVAPMPGNKIKFLG